MKIFSTLFCLCLSLSLFAQTQSGLVASYSMDDCSLLDDTGNGSNGTLFNGQCDSCGVLGKAIKFVDPSPNNNQDHTYGLLLGTINNDFRTNNFTISFYMKPTDNLGVKDIISKRLGCDDNNAFAIQFIPATNSINVLLSETSAKKVNVTAALDFGRCWQHVVFIRQGLTSKLYINGVLKAEKDVQTSDNLPVDISNAGVLSIVKSPCLATLEVPYQGLLDELYVYKKALNDDEIEMLDKNPHDVLNNNVTIFLGESVDLEATESCNVDYEWNPSNSLSASDETSVVATPDTSTLYTMSWTEDLVCISYDTVRITVVDPSNLDCNKIFLPKAFTPNNDNLNDTYGISNPYAVENLLSFEIFDRWGSRVFFTENPFDQWDGSFKGQEMNPGVLLYRVRFTCDGEEQIDVGSLAIMR